MAELQNLSGLSPSDGSAPCLSTSGRDVTPGVSRRSFLKTTAIAAGAVSASGFTGSLIGCTTPTTTTEKPTYVADEKFSGVCRPGCAQGCNIWYYVRDGKVVRTGVRDYPDTAYNRICMKGLSLPTRIYAPDRPKYPLRRVGARGSGQWEQITWDEAIAIITDKWKENLELYGDKCIAFTHRTGQDGMVFTIVHRRLRTMFGGIDMRLSADMHFGMASGATLGGGVASAANDDADWANSKTIFISGGNWTDTSPHQWHWVREAQANGAKIIAVNPVYNTTSAKADKWVPIRPATDAALYMAMMNIAIANDWVDWDFLRTQTVAPGLVKKSDGLFLRWSDLSGNADDKMLVVIDADTGEPGKIDEVTNPLMQGSHTVEGIEVTSPCDILMESISEWTPERASEVCDVSIADMEEITDLFFNNGPSMLSLSLGPDHRQSGYTHYTAMFTMGMLAGMYGKPGAGMGGSCARGIAYESGSLATAAGATPLGKSTLYSYSQIYDMAVNNKYGEQDIPLKMLIVQGTDFVHMIGNRQKTIEAFDALDLVVSINQVMNDTSQLADIVLPVVESCEYEDIYGARTYAPFLSYQEKVLDPQYECKSDFEIVKLLFAGMDHPEWFEWETEEDLLRAAYGDERYERLREEKCIYHSYFEEGGYKYVYGEDGKWGTGTGKLQFYIEKPARPIAYESYGQEMDLSALRVATFRLPKEAWNEDVPGYPKRELAAKYPLSLHADHVKWNAQTTTSKIPLLREFDPEPSMYISVDDAEARGIADGDHVRAFNDRGQVVVKAIHHRGMRPGMVNIPNGWLSDQFILGDCADILSAEQDPNNENCNFSDCLIEVEKYEGEV